MRLQARTTWLFSFGGISNGRKSRLFYINSDRRTRINRQRALGASDIHLDIFINLMLRGNATVIGDVIVDGQR